MHAQPVVEAAPRSRERQCRPRGVIRPSAKGTMVLRPSLPPAICTTMSVRPCAACAHVVPSSAAFAAARTAREKTVGMIMPALTASRPSRIIALRVSCIGLPSPQFIWYSGMDMSRYSMVRAAAAGSFAPPPGQRRPTHMLLCYGVVENHSPVVSSWLSTSAAT